MWRSGLFLALAGCQLGGNGDCVGGNLHECSTLPGYEIPRLGECTSGSEEGPTAWPGGQILVFQPAGVMGPPAMPDVAFGWVQADSVAMSHRLEEAQGGPELWRDAFWYEGPHDLHGTVTHETKVGTWRMEKEEGRLLMSSFSRAGGEVQRQVVSWDDQGRILGVEEVVPEPRMVSVAEWFDGDDPMGLPDHHVMHEVTFDAGGQAVSRRWVFDADMKLLKQAVMTADWQTERSALEFVYEDGRIVEEIATHRDISEPMPWATWDWTLDEQDRPLAITRTHFQGDQIAHLESHTYQWTDRGQLEKHTREIAGEERWEVEVTYNEQGVADTWRQRFFAPDGEQGWSQTVQSEWIGSYDPLFGQVNGTIVLSGEGGPDILVDTFFGFTCVGDEVE